MIGDASKNISVPIFFPGAFQGSTIYILINKLNIELQCTFMDYMGQKHCNGLYGSTSGPALVSLHYINYNSKIIHNSLLIKVPKIWYVLGVFVCYPMNNDTKFYGFIITCNLKVQLVMFYYQRISSLEDVSWKDKIKLLIWFKNIYEIK